MDRKGESRSAVNDIFRLINSGQVEHAKSNCRAFLDNHPNDINVLGLLGAILLKLGRPADAKPILEKTIRLEPNFAKPHEDLGMLFLHEGETEKAVGYFQNAIRLDGSQAGAYSGLAKALARLGDNEAAEEARQKYLKLSPVAQALEQANKLLAAGQSDRAEKICNDLSKQQPNDTKVLRLLARIASDDGRHLIAEGLLKRILKLSANDYRCYIDLGLYLGERGRYPEAVEVLEKAVALQPGVISSQQRLGDSLAIIGRSADALAVYETALKLDADYPPALVGRGHMLRILGRKDEAVKAYETAIAIRPDLGDTWWSLASLRNYRFSQDHFDEMRTRVDSAGDNVNSNISFHFALARAYEADNDFDSAWQHYEQGNSKKRSAVQYDPVQIETSHDAIIEFFDHEFLEQRGSPAGDGPAPIFIVGMPRSGSTLLEQILASHSDVEGAAELPYIGLLSEALGGPRAKGKQYPTVLADMAPDQLLSFGKSYIYYSRSNLPKKTRRFTDKMPANFTHVGLIHLAMPNAKIIDARRHPIDVCVGNYRQLFAQGKNFAYDLNECAEYFLDYIRVMNHWDEVLPGRVLKVQYEDVVADLEGQARRMLEYCELPWEDACLSFHETSRPVNTASSEQVRVPIYSDAVDYWRNYEQHLADVKEILAQALEEHSQR
jgi:tetratricopeptide (TPR) repeat protein